MSDIQPNDSQGLSQRVEDEIEAAYWEFRARQDPTQDKYPTSGERYAFKQATRALFYRLRGKP